MLQLTIYFVIASFKYEKEALAHTFQVNKPKKATSIKGMVTRFRRRVEKSQFDLCAILVAEHPEYNYINPERMDYSVELETNHGKPDDRTGNTHTGSDTQGARRVLEPAG